ncbi:type I secretion protein [Mesorhizobium sp. WSM2240]|uniref:Type I secretion protein n=3 Tax=unclassified Mesorhizobium TaxID=325217 RepID=A0AAU8DH59_9HYPH
MDKITETIAHFIGLFGIAIEEARLRKDYNEFQAQRALESEQPDLINVTVEGRAPYDLNGMDPGLLYQPLVPGLVKETPWSHVDYRPPQIPESTAAFSGNPAALVPATGFPGGASSAHPGLQTQPPGSIAVRINQEVRLSDNDYVGAGGHGLKFSPTADHGAEMGALLQAAARHAPFANLDAPGSIEEIEDFLLEAGPALTTFAQGYSEADDGAFVVSQEVIEGSFVNGAPATELPKLTDHLPEKEEAKANEPDPVDSVSGTGTVETEASVDLVAGSNTMVNSAVLTNNWLGGGVMAAVGDCVEINAIVQVNAWSDSDAIGLCVSGWKFDPAEATKAFNIAAFARVDPAAGKEAPGDASADFPKHWAVTKIDGDLISMNWIEQFSFVTDNDTHVLSSSGVTTMVTTGGNTTLNDVSLAELGFYYDLIIVGGNIYDANFIHQMNVLLDNDLVGGVKGFGTTGEASLSTGGNLLWNQAEIVTVGGTGGFEALPAHYKKAAENFEAGRNDLPGDVLHDSAFEGLAGVRVLYVSGNMFDLQFVKQTNILGDSDQVAMALNGIDDSFPDADWTISTGSNALINVAQIVDVDLTGKTYVGGNHYSDDILIQAEFVSPNPDLGGKDPDVLVNEAIAFLDDDIAGPSDNHTASVLQPGHDASHPDLMQTMLA